MEAKKNGKVEWIDYFKAIAVMLVVVGHTTGFYNSYIYQFHMAAFFFISGYCVNWEKGGKLWHIWKKFYTLLVPLTVVFLAGVISMYMLSAAGLYYKIWGEKFAYIGVKNMCLQYFLYNRNYVWWMGACWFFLVLFLIHLIHCVLWEYIRKRERYDWQIFIACIFVLYFIGIYCSQNGIHIWDVDLALIGQLYFGIGTICKLKIRGKFKKKVKYALTCNIAFFLVSSILLIEFSKISNIKVDYPSRNFQHYFLSILTACNGILWLYSCSKIFEKVLAKTRFLKKCILTIGSNTAGVVFFHFLFFKVCYLILNIAKVVDANYISNFTPTDPIGRNYLMLFLMVSVLGSIGFWKILVSTKIGRAIFGQDNELCAAIYNKHCRSFFAITKKLTNMHCEGLEEYRIKINAIPFWYKTAGLLSLLYVILTFFPLLFQGIILNDELRGRMNRKYGLMQLLKEGIKSEMRMGRPMRIMAAFNEATNFLTNCMVINKLVQIFVLFIAMMLFARLIYEIYQNKKVALLSILFITIFMPITFEHAAPNAFIGLAAIPLVWMFISLTAWCKYLSLHRKKDMVIAILGWIFSLLGYEYMVTYTPLFLLLYLVKKKQCKSIKDCIHTCSLPVACSCMYLINMFLLTKIINVQYDGVKMGFVSIQSSWQIVKTLISSSVPGWYLFNAKYQYLMYALTGEKYFGLYQLISEQSLVDTDTIKNQLLDFLSCNVVSVRMIIWIIVTVVILWLVLTRCNMQHRSKIFGLQTIVTVVSLLVYLVIPALPNAVSQIYQGAVSENFFTSLPVSLAIFFTVCLLLSYITFLLLEFFKQKKLFILTIMCLILLCAVPVQIMNGVIGKEQKDNYNRLTEIESLLQTKCMKNLDNSAVYAKDIFETKNTLAIHKSYWDSLASFHGLRIHFLKSGNADFQIFYTDSEYFCIIGKLEIAVMSRKKLPAKFKLQTGDNEFCFADSEKYYWDSGFLCYRFTKNNIAVIEDESVAFEREYRSAGNTLATSNVIQGYYEDGWVSSVSEFEIYSGDSGKIKIEGYLPEKLLSKAADEEYQISVFINDKEMARKQVQEGFFNFYVQAESKRVVTLKLISNFSVETQNADIRKLSYILNNLESN